MGAETPVILPDQKIVFLRTVKSLPPVFTDQEWESIKSKHYIHETGAINNICPGYAGTIRHGLDWEKQRCLRSLEKADEKQKEFLRCVIDSIDAVLRLTRRYRLEALRRGDTEVADILSRIPKNGAKTFREALQFLRILHFTLWCEGEYQITVGRFDQYMSDYLKADLDSGQLDLQQALELLEEFFISFNIDSDLYPGVQQGDNGQSMMLGGVDSNGEEAYNLLSELCLKASCELKLIDPKINLRVSSKTPLSVFESGTRLTREGLGFPQYSNDDIVIDGLVKKGYSLEDARDYTVAAC
ncbi:MAG: pyruvate formate lyase family protein, partial [Clostridia bacterium]|nr:pyruvate formate lyase family protein [Clostridia bacterium]